MYRDIYWICNSLNLWTNIEEVARRFNVHEILACWARATVEVFLLIYHGERLRLKLFLFLALIAKLTQSSGLFKSILQSLIQRNSL